MAEQDKKDLPEELPAPLLQDKVKKQQKVMQGGRLEKDW